MEARLQLCIKTTDKHIHQEDKGEVGRPIQVLSDFFRVPAGTERFLYHWHGTSINTISEWTQQITTMPANKNALIRYKTIDRCLRNRFKRWTIDDLVDACSDALYDMEGIMKGVSVRTVQGDIQMMRSDKLGFNAPIEVYDNKFYRYADRDYSISDNPLNADDYELVEKAVMLINEVPEDKTLIELKAVLSKLKGKLMFVL